MTHRRSHHKRALPHEHLQLPGNVSAAALQRLRAAGLHAGIAGLAAGVTLAEAEPLLDALATEQVRRTYNALFAPAWANGSTVPAHPTARSRAQARRRERRQSEREERASQAE